MQLSLTPREWSWFEPKLTTGSARVRTDQYHSGEPPPVRGVSSFWRRQRGLWFLTRVAELGGSAQRAVGGFGLASLSLALGATLASIAPASTAHEIPR